MAKILLVEDAESLREVLTSILEEGGHTVRPFPDAESALAALDDTDCIISDFRLPGMDAIAFLQQVRSKLPETPFLIMTAFGSMEIAVEAMKKGANDFIPKPFDPARICKAVDDLITHHQITERTESFRQGRVRKFISAHPSIKKILEQARKVARVESPVMILGESGTGKELLARYIHEQSPRKDQQFIAVNCAAMPADLLESEFFGHEQGAFTGATQTRVGVFEAASEGTIFLDEIGEMPTQLQVKLLRALQEHEIKRVGGTRTIKVNPRILSATNIDITKALDERTFREDLYYRIAVVTFTIPPLSERPCDIPLLAGHFLEYFSGAAGKALTLSKESLELLCSHRWPGNARELENVMERAVILASGEITPAHLGFQPQIDFEAIETATKSLTEIAALAARQTEISLIEKALLRSAGNKAKAARQLGVSYKTLLNKVKEYEIADTDR